MTKYLLLALVFLVVFAALVAVFFAVFPSIGNSFVCRYYYGGEVWKTQNPLNGEVNSWCVLPPHGVIDGPAW